MLVLFALFLVFKWTRLSTFFADVRLYPFTGARKFVHPRKIAMIMASSAVISLFSAPCTHSQFVTWSEFLTPVLFMGSNLLLRERIILFVLIQICWHEMYIGQCELFVRETYSLLGFLGYLGLVWGMFFHTDYLKDDNNESEDHQESKPGEKKSQIKENSTRKNSKHNSNKTKNV